MSFHSKDPLRSLSKFTIQVAEKNWGEEIRRFIDLTERGKSNDVADGSIIQVSTVFEKRARYRKCIPCFMGPILATPISKFQNEHFLVERGFAG